MGQTISGSPQQARGSFILSANGQQTLLRFTSENSPLPSDNVQDIAIDPFTGEVYFATINGLVSYKGTSTAPRDTLEDVFVFPNPVRPQYQGACYHRWLDGKGQCENHRFGRKLSVSANKPRRKYHLGHNSLWQV